jgi:hypothetical protein
LLITYYLLLIAYYLLLITYYLLLITYYLFLITYSLFLTPMNPQEARQIAYIQLVEALLKCPPHLEEKLLAANPELVDLGLVMTMLAVARRMMQQNDPRATPAIEWLVGFAQQLAQKLGLEMDESPEEDDEEYRTFVLQLLQTVHDSEGDEATVHAFLKSHLNRLMDYSRSEPSHNGNYLSLQP